MDFANVRAHTAGMPERPSHDEPGILTEKPEPRAEGVLISRAMERRGLTARAAAIQLGMSEGRLRQIVNGYQALGQGQFRLVIGKAIRVAQLAKLVGVTPAQLANAGREDAAHILLDLLSEEAAAAPQQDQPVNEEELCAIRDNDQLPHHLRQWAGSLVDQLHAIRDAERAASDELRRKRAG
ncbi:hypothetical protein [Micromonospora sp. RV43]|uniref:hypothetical protein n=1 Tax=Micromonospora sp. RV43 TaxID=1661387 RepID=UPI00064BA94D|nr:hypothetical protein [Micromonospora sp. RV43]